MNKFQKGDRVAHNAFGAAPREDASQGEVLRYKENGRVVVLWDEAGELDYPEENLTLLSAAETLENNAVSPEQEDAVSHPAHYTSDPSGVECITITRHRNFNVGNAIKYLWRAGLKKDASKADIDKQVEDLNKAIFYIKDEIERLQEAK